MLSFEERKKVFDLGLQDRGMNSGYIQLLESGKVHIECMLSPEKLAVVAQLAQLNMVLVGVPWTIDSDSLS